MMEALIFALALLILNLTDGAPTTYKYVESENGVETNINWYECANSDLHSWMDLKAKNGVSKVQANGKPETSKHSYVLAQYHSFYNCRDNAVTHRRISFEDVTSARVDIPKNLKRANVTTAVRALVVTEECPIVCEYCESCGGEICYPVCPDLWEEADVTLTATFVGTGTPQGPYKSTSHSNSQDGFYHSTSSRTTMDATFSDIIFSVNGDFISIPHNPFSYFATIYTAKNGTFETIRNFY